MSALDVTALLEEVKQTPYEELHVHAPHTGVVRFPEAVQPGLAVVGAADPTDPASVKKATLLAELERERNTKAIHAPEKGELMVVRRELEGTFVEAGTELATIRHFLSKDEVLERILQKALYLFLAPERAKYYFVPEIDAKIASSGLKSVNVKEGMDCVIMSRMKRETMLPYSGPEGVVYAQYFTVGENMDAGAPLFGVCPPDQLDIIQDVVIRVQTEWVEG